MNLRIIFSLLVWGSQTSREGWHHVILGFCCVQALQTSPGHRAQDRKVTEELNIIACAQTACQKKQEPILERYFCLGNTTDVS